MKQGALPDPFWLMAFGAGINRPVFVARIKRRRNRTSRFGPETGRLIDEELSFEVASRLVASSFATQTQLFRPFYTIGVVGGLRSDRSGGGPDKSVLIVTRNICADKNISVRRLLIVIYCTDVGEVLFARSSSQLCQTPGSGVNCDYIQCNW